MATEPKKEKTEPRYCPFCDDEMETSDVPVCQQCGVSVFLCPNCKKPVPRENRTCPDCGTKITGSA